MVSIKQIFAIAASSLLTCGASAQWVGYEYISHSTDKLQTAYGTHAEVTPNGRYVVYEASERTLVTPNTVNSNIYLYDRKTGVTELISVDNSGFEGNQGSFKSSISDNGCRVVFISASTNLVPGAGGGPAEVFVRDRCTNPPQTRVVSASAAGVPGMTYSDTAHAESNGPRIASGGTYAVFYTYATNIVGGTCNVCTKVVRKNLDTGAVDLVSVKPGGGIGEGWYADISGEGSRVVFYGSEYGLGLGSKSVWDHFLWDAAQPTTLTIVSTGSNGERQISSGGIFYDGQGHTPGISANGRYVSFSTTSGTLTSLGGNGKHQIYVKDTVTGQLSLASVSSTGGLGDDDSNWLDRPALSRNGRYVAFYSYANNLITSTAFVKPIVRDLVTNTTTLVADRSVSISPPISLSPDNFGRYVVFSTGQTTLDNKFPNTQGLYLADLDPLKPAMVDLTPILMLLLD